MCLHNKTILFLFLFLFLLLFFPQANAQNSIPMLKTIDVSFNKKSKNFDKKNFFPLVIFKEDTWLSLSELSGYYFISTPPDISKNNNASSETLFSVTVSKNGKCPKAQEASLNYSSVYKNYETFGIGATILKQNVSGEKKFPFHYSFSSPFSVKVKAGSCIFLGIDGSNFSSENIYTAGGHINISYKINNPQPVSTYLVGLDGEFMISANNFYRPTLNAYVVLPVSYKNNMLNRKVINVFGNASATPRINNNQLEIQKNNWHVIHIISIYTNNSCQIAFPNHKNTKFFWNDKSGTSSKQNLSFVFKKSSYKIATLTLGDGNLSSSTKQINKTLSPVTLHDGDCLVDAIIPVGTQQWTPPINTESQIYVQMTN
ncbi:hypothetical protein [Acetobacter indonesiensis]|uniref:hypothetical protein n=1 Tax=Acetobacter indonesiensis TaxID=104101 RepID=UPI0020A5F008|nr:hypothetical protein [Acetobacter indonesiensis]MCP1230427.1 hypothetical protein [Acetobacter indonesiensis]